MTHSIYSLLAKLDAGKYYYTLSRNRPDSILVSVTFVGERTEIDVFDDGHMEVSRFNGKEDIVGDETLILNLIEQNDEENGA